MTLIPSQDADRLKRDFRKELKKEVTLKLFTQSSTVLTIPGQECAYCPQTQQFLEEIAALTPKINLEVYNFYSQPEEKSRYGIDRIPAVVFGENGDSRAKFYGIPMGYELATVIEDIKTLSRGVSPLSMDTRKKLRKLEHPVHIQVFVTPTCGYCPGMARLAHAMAFDSPLVTSDVIEVQEFPSLGQAYAVRGVPKIVIGSPSQLIGMVPQVQFAGAIPESQFVAGVLEVGGPENQSYSEGAEEAGGARRLESRK